MAYQHDIFISYKRSMVGDRWLTEHFLPLFQAYVENDIVTYCNRDSEGIFFDQTRLNSTTRQLDQAGIEPGQDWKDALATALENSRCLLAICTPQYFRSQWCTIEWETFQKRAQSTSKTVIVPVTIHDGKSFPAPVRALQLVDLNKYWIIGEGFVKTERYTQFQDELRLLAERVAQLIADAPDHSNWRTVETAPVAAAPHIGTPRL